MSEAWTADFANLEELYASYWDCIADEAVANDPETYPTLRHVYYAWTGEFDVKPCANALDEMQDPDAQPAQPEGSKGEESPKMDTTQHKAHRTNAMRNPEAMEECLRAHGVENIPTARQARIKLHDSLCKPDADASEPEATSQPTSEPEPAQPTPPRRRSPKAKPEPQPEPKAEEPCTYKRSGKHCIGIAGHEGSHVMRGATEVPEAKPEPKPQPDLREHSVPFVPLVKKGRNLVATCPACGKSFVEKVDKVGEQTTQHYAEHYSQAHPFLGETAKPQPESKPQPRTRTRKAAPKAEEPAKPQTRGRKAQPKPEPAKPATRGRKPAAGKPATSEPKAAANGTSPHVRKQAMARAIVNLVAEHFADASAADKEKISYWLRNLPTGNPDLPGCVGGHLRYWPESLPRPVGIGWHAPAE